MATYALREAVSITAEELPSRRVKPMLVKGSPRYLSEFGIVRTSPRRRERLA